MVLTATQTKGGRDGLGQCLVPENIKDGEKKVMFNRRRHINDHIWSIAFLKPLFLMEYTRVMQDYCKAVILCISLQQETSGNEMYSNNNSNLFLALYVPVRFDLLVLPSQPWDMAGWKHQASKHHYKSFAMFKSL